MDLVELSRRLENLLRIGTVTAVDHAAVRCRVKSGGLDTDWLRWQTARAGETTTWDPPTVGEQCIVLSPSGEPGNGIVLYGLDSDLIAPPSNDPAMHVTKWPDGGFAHYNHETSEYFLKVPPKGRIVMNVGATTLEMRSELTTLTTPTFKVNAAERIEMTTLFCLVNALNTVFNGTVTVGELFRFLNHMIGLNAAEIIGGLTVIGSETVTGSLDVGGGITAGGSIIDSGGNTNHHTHD